MKKILLIALTALVLGIGAAAVGGHGGNALVSGRGGISGEVHADVGAPAIAASRPSAGGDINPEVGAPAIAGGAYGGVLGDEVEPAIAGSKAGASVNAG
jgi:hypothetical protein